MSVRGHGAEKGGAVTLLDDQTVLSGRSDPVSLVEAKIAAYRYTSRIVDVAGDPGRVVGTIGVVEAYLRESKDRADFELRCWALEEQTTNLGLHPLNRNPGAEKNRSNLPSPTALVRAAEKICRYATR